MENINTFKQFDNMAFIISDAKAASKQVREGSLTHKLGWCAFAIMASGSEADKQSLTDSIAKGAAYETFKGTVSHAKAVLAHLQQGLEVEGNSFDSIQALLNDNAIPEVKVYNLYKVVKGESKAESEAEKRERAIRKHAMAMHQVAFPSVALTNKVFDASEHKAQFLVDAAMVVDERLAASAKVQANESREQLINRLVNEIVSNGLQDVILDALATANTQAQAA